MRTYIYTILYYLCKVHEEYSKSLSRTSAIRIFFFIKMYIRTCTISMANVCVPIFDFPCKRVYIHYNSEINISKIRTSLGATGFHGLFGMELASRTIHAGLGTNTVACHRVT